MKTDVKWKVGDKVRVRRKFDSGTFVLKVTEVLTNDQGVTLYRGEKRGKGAEVVTVTVRADRVVGEARSNRKAQTAKRFTKTEARNLYREADEAGRKAAEAAVPTPMVVVQRENPFDDSSAIVKEYAPVMGGVCGFAWVTVRPANSSFALWLKKNQGARTGYYGGMELWVSGYGQSMQRKEAYAKAFAQVLRDNGLDASAGSRMD